MRMHLIYPRWPKLDRQTEFHLPPHGPVVFAAALTGHVEVSFTDENREPIDFDAGADLVAISTMLTAQLPRAFDPKVVAPYLFDEFGIVDPFDPDPTCLCGHRRHRGGLDGSRCGQLDRGRR